MNRILGLGIAAAALATAAFTASAAADESNLKLYYLGSNTWEDAWTDSWCTPWSERVTIVLPDGTRRRLERPTYRWSNPRRLEARTYAWNDQRSAKSRYWDDDDRPRKSKYRDDDDIEVDVKVKTYSDDEGTVKVYSDDDWRWEKAKANAYKLDKKARASTRKLRAEARASTGSWGSTSDRRLASRSSSRYDDDWSYRRRSSRYDWDRRDRWDDRYGSRGHFEFSIMGGFATIKSSDVFLDDIRTVPAIGVLGISVNPAFAIEGEFTMSVPVRQTFDFGGGVTAERKGPDLLFYQAGVRIGAPSGAWTPYVAAGAGVATFLQNSEPNRYPLIDRSQTMPAANIGGGALIRIGPLLSARLDLREFALFPPDNGTGITTGGSSDVIWMPRGSFGFTYGY